MNSLTRGVAALACLSAGFSGCVSDTKLSEVEKAMLIKEKRLEARDVLEKFRATDGQELKLLERYADLHRETTEVAPATCPRCWAAYGESLSMLGWYHWDIYRDILDEADAARSKKEKESLLAEADAYKEVWTDYFTRSNHAYETHFRSPDVPAVHPYSFERVMRHYELLGNYSRALVYLGRYVDSYPNMEAVDRQKVEKLRRLYRQEEQRQKERGLKAGEAAPRRPAARASSKASARSGSPSRVQRELEAEELDE